MKKKIFIAAIFSFLITNTHAKTSFVFGVKPGMNMNAAYVGIKQGKFLPYLGTDLLWISASGKYEKSCESYQSQNTYTKETTTVNFSGKTFLLVPHFGLKYFLNEMPTRPYVFTGIFLGLPLVDLEADGTKEIWEYEDSQLIRHTQEETEENFSAVKQTVKEALGFWGLSFGAGAEYFFNPQFSIGGEYGFRLIFDSAEYEDVTGDLDPEALTGYRNKLKAEVSASLKVSYALITANFYF